MRVEETLRRWLRFNGIGLAGLAVQLGAVAGLIRLLSVHYLIATSVAVEAAVLHNFVWHQRWTWRDRPTRSPREVVARLIRFHLLNGVVSIAGNVALVAALSGRGGLDPVAANVIAVVACSIVNFFGSDALVFKKGRASGPVHRTLAVGVFTAIAVLQPDVRASAEPLDTRLQPATLTAWRSYERLVDDRYAMASSAGGFFVQDAYAGGKGWRQVIAAGGTSMVRLDAAAPGGPAAAVPEGRIHHWVGAVFVPGITLDRLLAYLEDHAGRESESYDDVTASRLLARNGDHLRVFMKLRRTKVITVNYNTEHTVDYRRIGPSRASARSVATKIAELVGEGTPQEREKPAGADSGYLWRLNAYWRYEQTRDGVVVECESVSLSRDIPYLVRFVVSGMAEGVARDSLERTLTSLRRALLTLH